MGIQRPEPVTANATQHRAPTDTLRPTVPDNEYGTESGSLPLVGDMGALPVSTLVRQIPLINELPLVSSLSAPLAMLRALPVVGMVAGLLPLE